MKKNKHPKLFVAMGIGIIVAVAFGITYLKLYFDDQNSTISIPRSYLECLSVAADGYINSTEATTKCKFFVHTENEDLYSECRSVGGYVPGSDSNINIDLARPCPMCPGCPCPNPEDYCRLVYYNPHFDFPQNYKECKEASGDGGSLYGVKSCDISVSTKGAYNSNIARKIVDQCLVLKGHTLGSELPDTCHAEFFSNEIYPVE